MNKNNIVTVCDKNKFWYNDKVKNVFTLFERLKKDD